MAFKGTASKSASGASMSKYDVEVEARLKALEAQAHPDRCNDDTGGGDCAALEAKVDRLIEILNRSSAFTGSCPRDVDGVKRFV
jgi:hypothetical protein